MARVLRRRDFDVAGVQSQRGGPVIGFVARKRLENGVVGDHLQPMTADLLISDSTSLPTVLSVLKVRQHSFVLIGPDVKGIVTRAGTTLGFIDDDKPSAFIETPAANKILLDDDEGMVQLSDQNGNEITLSKDGIVIKSAKDLKIEASGNVEIKGTKVDVK